MKVFRESVDCQTVVDLWISIQLTVTWLRLWWHFPQQENFTTNVWLAELGAALILAFWCKPTDTRPGDLWHCAQPAAIYPRDTWVWRTHIHTEQVLHWAERNHEWRRLAAKLCTEVTRSIQHFRTWMVVNVTPPDTNTRAPETLGAWGRTDGVYSPLLCKFSGGVQSIVLTDIVGLLSTIDWCTDYRGVSTDVQYVD